MLISLMQGRRIPSGNSRIAGAPAPLPVSADLSTDEVASLRGWDQLAALPYKSPAAGRDAKAPLQLSEYAGFEAFDNLGVPAPAASVATAPVVNALPLSLPAAAVVAPPPAHKRMCDSGQVCTSHTDKDGSDVQICKDLPPTPSNRANLCPRDIIIIKFVFIAGPIMLLPVCIGVSGRMYSQWRARQEEEEDG